MIVLKIFELRVSCNTVDFLRLLSVESGSNDSYIYLLNAY